VQPPCEVKKRRRSFPQAIRSRKLRRDSRFHYLCGYRATLAHWLTAVRGVSVLSLEKPLGPDAAGQGLTILRQLAAEAPGPDARAETADLTRHLAAAIDALPQQEKVVLSLYYFEELTLREIGAVLEVTESRISQIRTKAILHLRARLQNLTQGAYAPVG